MKRAGKLYEAVCDPENLRLAYCKAKRGKEGRGDVRAFSREVSAHLNRLRRDLVDQTVRVGNYRYFSIRDPKPRIICAAAFRERVLHHAIMNVCDPVFERYQAFDSYATRRDKGTFAALNRARKFATRYPWFLKLDVRKYFDSIDHALLKTLLRRLFKDFALLALLDRIIDSYDTEEGKGVPIGNLTSQYFANHVLAVADHYIKEELRVGGYVRYMDDMVLWCEDRHTLKAYRKAVERFLKKRLLLDLKPVCLNRADQGLPFLGFRVFPDRATLRFGSRRRFRTKMRRLMEMYAKNRIGQREFGERGLALAAHVAHARSTGFRRAVIDEWGRRPRARTA